MADSPFKLFEPYGPNEKDTFYGRDEDVYALYYLLQQTRILLIYGPSGTGKTSLISAGLPKVYKITSWYPISVKRRDDINKSLRLEIGRELKQQEPITDLVQTIRDLYESCWIPIHLVFDQFEEVFTNGKDEERWAFFQDLQTLINSNIPCKILLCMREEYIGYLYEYEPLVPTLFEKRFRVEPMHDSTVQMVIASICKQYSITMEHLGMGENSTTLQILNQLKENKQAAYLPYVQVYLHYLYLSTPIENGNRIFNVAGIAAVGKLGNVLRKFISSQIEIAQTFLETHHAAPEDFVLNLLDEFATDKGTKCSRKQTELAIILHVPEILVKSALAHFSDTAKLLRADEDDLERYEPIHDAIAKQIHELRTTEDKDFKAFTRLLQLSYESWIRDNKTTQRLLPELDLIKAAMYQPRLERREEYMQYWLPYLEASKKHLNKRKYRNQFLNVILSSVALVALTAFMIALYLNRLTQLEKLNTETALLLYKKEALKRYLQDSDTYHKSEDDPFALSALDSAKKIYRIYFNNSFEFKKTIEDLDKKLK